MRISRSEPKASSQVYSIYCLDISLLYLFVDKLKSKCKAVELDNQLAVMLTVTVEKEKNLKR